ncbi:MAG: glutamate 5-kinase, partial [Clostridiales bacterium]|nr:glutamate 5-kinase [Clostridiales bacterium]
MTREDLKNRKRIIVKIGTTSLTYPNGNINFRRFDRLAAVLTDIQNSGRDIILVSSGAIAVGAKRLGLRERPRDIVGKPAYSAVGQAILMQYYE